MRREGAKNKQRKQALLQHQRDLEGQIRSIEEHDQAAEGVEAFCREVGTNLDELSFAEQRQLLAAVSLRAVLHPDRVDARVVFPRLYATIAQTSASLCNSDQTVPKLPFFIAVALR